MNHFIKAMFGQLFGTAYQDVTHIEEKNSRAELPILPNTMVGACATPEIGDRPTIFYDIDGVLHPLNDESLSCAYHLVEIVQRLPELQLVMSSTWRYSMDYEYFYKKFPIEICERTVGFTPIVREPYHRREYEVTAFTKYFNLSNILCLDDSDALFSPSFSQLYKINPCTGLTAEDADKIIAYFSI